MCNLREVFVNLREGFVVAPWRLREAFLKTRSAKASRRRHGRLHLETIRQIMTSPHCLYENGRPGSSEVPRNPLTRWDVSSIPANGIFLTKKTKKLNKNAQRVEND